MCYIFEANHPLHLLRAYRVDPVTAPRNHQSEIERSGSTEAMEVSRDHLEAVSQEYLKFNFIFRAC